MYKSGSESNVQNIEFIDEIERLETLLKEKTDLIKDLEKDIYLLVQD